MEQDSSASGTAKFWISLVPLLVEASRSLCYVSMDRAHCPESLMQDLEDDLAHGIFPAIVAPNLEEFLSIFQGEHIHGAKRELYV